MNLRSFCYLVVYAFFLSASAVFVRGNINVYFLLCFPVFFAVTNMYFHNIPTPRVTLKDPKLGILGAFSWFCGRASREIVQIAIADLSRDRKEMKKEGRSLWFIKTVIYWRTLTTILPIFWDGLVRVMKAILPFAKFLKIR